MMTHTDDDIRALMSDHLEGALDDATMLLVNEALSTRPALAEEYRLLAETVAALRALPAPGAPVDLAARVRSRLGTDTSSLPLAALAGPAVVANDDRPTSTVRDAGTVVLGPASWWSPSRIATAVASLAVAAAFAAVFVGPSQRTASDTGMLGAAVGTVDGAVVVEWRGPAFNRPALLEAAQTAGMDFDTDATEFVGDRRSAAAFFVELKGLAVSMGGDLEGRVPPDADRIIVRLR